MKSEEEVEEKIEELGERIEFAAEYHEFTYKDLLYAKQIAMQWVLDK